MTSWMKWAVAPIAALAFVLATAAVTARAEEGGATGKGSISGKVVDSTGKAVSGATVRVVVAKEGKGKASKLSVIALEEEGGGKHKGKEGKNAQPPVAETTTDADGKFTASDIPAGKYRVGAMLKGVGKGNSAVTVEDGKTAEVTITLNAEKAK